MEAMTFAILEFYKYLPRKEEEEEEEEEFHQFNIGHPLRF